MYELKEKIQAIIDEGQFFELTYTVDVPGIETEETVCKFHLRSMCELILSRP